jgi:hypothetical protein
MAGNIFLLWPSAAAFKKSGVLDSVVPHVFTEQAADVDNLQHASSHEGYILRNRVEHDTSSSALICWIHLAMKIIINHKII